MDDPTASPPASSGRLDRWLSIAAGVGALCAVAVSLYQAALAREQQRASAWPYLAQSNSFGAGESYTRTVQNDGVGLARVRSFHVLVDGAPVRTWADAVRALTGAPEPALVYSSLGRGTVLPPGTARAVLTLPAGERAAAFWLAAQTRLDTVVCYCSIYDECWRADSRRPEPDALDACREDAATAFTD